MNGGVVMNNAYTDFPLRRRLMVEGTSAHRIDPLLTAAELLSSIRGNRADRHPLARWASELADLHRAADPDNLTSKPAFNRARDGLVHSIDLWIERLVPQHRRGATVHTETLGSVIDRIAAAQVRADAVLDRSAGMAEPSVHAAWYHLAELVDGYNDLAAAVVTGARRLPAPCSATSTSGDKE
ncbi:DUF4254 domain-containing protein [Nocardia sp. NPDC006044]|uniref:DUF4254 domain-containing protein n=1 Tax=Nocardia sp. NPDC006044 TaxID=3364306 RepID=UPI003681D3EB